MEKEKGRWITVKGNHIFIKDGQSIEEATKEFFAKKDDFTGEKPTKKEDSNIEISKRFLLTYDEEMAAREKDKKIQIKKPSTISDKPLDSFLRTE